MTTTGQVSSHPAELPAERVDDDSSIETGKRATLSSRGEDAAPKETSNNYYLGTERGEPYPLFDTDTEKSTMYGKGNRRIGAADFADVFQRRCLLLEERDGSFFSWGKKIKLVILHRNQDCRTSH